MICPTYFKLIRNRLNKTVGDIKNLPQNSKSSNHQDLECGWDYIWFYFKCTLSLSTYCLEMYENDARNRKELKIFFIPTALVAVQHFLSHFMAHQTKLQAPREIANRDVRNNYISKKWLAFFTSAITCEVSSDITQFKNQKDIPPEWKIWFADYMKKLHGKEAMTEVWRRINDTCRSYLTKFLSTHTPSKSIAVITNKLEDYDSSLVRVFKKVKAQDDKMDDMFPRAGIQRFRSEDDLVEEETYSDSNEGSGDVDVYSLSSTEPAVEQIGNDQCGFRRYHSENDAEYTSWEFDLPFLPKLTEEMIGTANDVLFREMPVLKGFSPTHYPQCSCFEVEKGVHRYDLSREFDYTFSSKGNRNRGSHEVSAGNILCLRDGKHLHSDVMQAFISMFNSQEQKKARDRPGYKPAVMIDSFFVVGLCFHMNQLRDGYHRLIYEKKYYKRLKFSVVEGEGKSAERVCAAYDVFVGISTLYVQYNIHNTHWVFFKICPTTLNQCYFDSVHWRLADSNEHMHVSTCLHKWLIDLYRDTRGYDHPNKRKWRKEDVVDLNNILGNPHQAGLDCGLHTCIIPVMIQEGLPLHLLGNGSVSSGREIRIRMLLSLYKRKWLFEANDLARMK
jgi:hypothetical protein